MLRDVQEYAEGYRCVKSAVTKMVATPLLEYGGIQLLQQWFIVDQWIVFFLEAADPLRDQIEEDVAGLDVGVDTYLFRAFPVLSLCATMCAQ